MNRPPFLALGVAAAVTASSLAGVARADVPDATWGALRGRDVIVETQSGKLVGGKLIDVRPKTVALVLPDGESLMIDRENVRSARAAGAELVPSYPPAESPQKEPPRPGQEWHEGDEIPVGYRTVTESRKGLIIAGSVLFGTAWVGSAIAGGVMSRGLLAVPVAGPWILAVPSFQGGSMNATFGLLFALDGVTQAVGLTLLIYGVAAPKKTVLVPYSSTAAKTWWMPTPMSFGNGSIGLGIVGTM